MVSRVCVFARLVNPSHKNLVEISVAWRDRVLSDSAMSHIKVEGERAGVTEDF